MSDLDFVVVNEAKRTYQYGECEIAYHDVVRVCVRPSGSHRLELKSGEKVIVLPGFKAVKIEVDKWTF